MWLASRIWGWDFPRPVTKSFSHTMQTRNEKGNTQTRNEKALHKNSSYFFLSQYFLVWSKIKHQKTDKGSIFNGENFFRFRGKLFVTVLVVFPTRIREANHVCSREAGTEFLNFIAKIVTSG